MAVSMVAPTAGSKVDTSVVKLVGSMAALKVVN